MRALAAVAVLLLLPGCLQGGMSEYFPPASELPEGITPVDPDSPEWKLVAPFLGMTTNPGRVGALDNLPRQDLGKVEAAEAYLLQDAFTKSYGIFAVRFAAAEDVGALLAAGEARACDGQEMAHVLRDGLTYVIVGGDGGSERGRAALRGLADAVQARSGATLVC